jgi:hypothetical protein
MKPSFVHPMMNGPLACLSDGCRFVNVSQSNAQRKLNAVLQA